MTEQDFEFIRKLLKERAAVVLEPGKQYLVESRLSPLIRQMEMETVSDLVTHLRTRVDHLLYTQVVEAMVTTETSFFRDHNPFESLRKTVLPDLIARRRNQKSLIIWSAACATGQEPYSIAILLREHFPELHDWNVNLIASDFSHDVLERAAEGRFNQIEVNRGMPAAMLVKYFNQHGTTWQLKPEIRNMVRFREVNLSRTWPLLPHMDLILLRNVLIYFDVEMKKTILRRVAQVLKPDGYLILGGAETTLTLVDLYRRLESLRSGFYQLKN